mgnify:CR=1 FL=1
MFKTALSLGLFLISSALMAGSLTIEVFHTDSQRLINVKDAERLALISRYDLSRAERIEERLSENLSNDPQIAAKQAKKILTQNSQSIMREFSDAYQGTLKAHGYELKKLPAIVFNHGESVIYGELNLSKAIKRYQQQHAKSKKK